MNNNEFLALAVTHKIEKKAEKSILFKEGDTATDFFAIVSGSVLLTQGNQVVSAPTTIGFEDVLRNGNYSCTAIAATDISFIKVDASKQKNYLKLCPDQALDIIKRALGLENKEAGVAQPVSANTPVVSAVQKTTDEIQSKQDRLAAASMVFNIPSQHRLYSDTVKVITDAKFLHLNEHVCPVCNTKFSEKNVLFSLLRTVKTNLDLRVQYMDFEPLWYGVMVCPNCKYANNEKGFANVGTFEAKNILSRLNDAGVAQINEIYTEQHSIDDVFIAFYDALFCTESIGENSITKATLWLNLVWLYEDVGDSTMVAIASQKALECYNYIFNETRHFETPEEEQQIYMIMAELNLRIGNKEQALIFLTEGFKGNSNNRLYKEKCRRRYEELRES